MQATRQIDVISTVIFHFPRMSTLADLAKSFNDLILTVLVLHNN